jgi:hypothetical protein
MQLNTTSIEQFISEAVKAYQDLVAGHSVTAIDRVRQHLADYRSDLLPEIDRRLRECNDLLRKGLREEALDYARDRPDLIKVATLCDFRRFGAEGDRWNERAAEEGVSPWPLPKVEFLQELLAAERESHELKPLLDRWRRLNIARGPLTSRIEVLRKLRGHDPNSSAWAEMLREFEGFRLAEIESLVVQFQENSAEDEQAYQVAESLRKELSSQWVCVSPPDDLRQQLDQFLKEAKKCHRRLSLKTLAGKIIDAHREKDAHWLEKLLGKWAEYVLTAEEEKQWHGVVAIEKEITDRDRLQSLILGLEQSVVERPASFRMRIDWRNELEQLWVEVEDLTAIVAVDSSDRERLEILHDRLWDEIEAVDGQQKTRRVVQFCSVAAVILLIASVTFAYVWNGQREQLVEQSVAMLRETGNEIETGLIYDEPTYYRSWPEWLRQDPRVAEGISDVQQRFAAQESRRSRFDASLIAANERLREIERDTRESPLEPWSEDFQAATRSVAEMEQEGLALIESERAKVERVSSTLSTIANKWLRLADLKFVNDVQGLDARVTNLMNSVSDDLEKNRQILAGYDAALSDLQRLCVSAACDGAAPPYAATHRVSEAAAKRVSVDSNLSQKLQDVRRLLLKFEGLEAREKVADARLGERRFSAYAETIREIANDLSGTKDAEAVDYKIVADAQPAWATLGAWEDFCCNLTNPIGETSEECEVSLERFENLSEDVRKLVYARALGPMEKYLKRGKLRTAEVAEGLAVKLQESLDGSFGKGISGVVWPANGEQDNGGYEYYYVLTQDRPNGNRKEEIEYVVAWQDPVVFSWQKKKLNFVPGVYRSDDAPQSLVAGRCLAIVAKLKANPGNLERNIVEVLRSAVAVDGGGQKILPPIDPCVHVLLVRRLVKACIEVSKNTEPSLRKSIELITAGNELNGAPVQLRGVRNEVFMEVINPKNEVGGFELDRARKTSDGFIDQLRRDLNLLEKNIDEEEKNVNKIQLVWYEVAGRLWKRRDGRWQVRGGDPEKRKDKTLFVVSRPFAGSGVRQLIQCNGEGKLPAGAALNARAGSPVFLEHTSKLSGLNPEKKQEGD